MRTVAVQAQHLTALCGGSDAHGLRLEVDGVKGVLASVRPAKDSDEVWLIWNHDHDDIEWMEQSSVVTNHAPTGELRWTFGAEHEHLAVFVGVDLHCVTEPPSS